MSRTTIVLGEDLQDKAKEFDVNVSAICREAVEQAIAAKMVARRIGDEYERVTAYLEHPTESEERGQHVAFRGKLVHDDPTDGTYYLTEGGEVAIVNERGILWHGDVNDLEEGYAFQAMKAALGEVVFPTDLDI